MAKSIYPGIAVVVLSLSLGAGLAHQYDKGAYQKLQLQVSTAQAQAKDAAEAKEAADRKTGDAIAARFTAETQVASLNFNQIRKETTNVKTSLRLAGVPDVNLPVGWVRQYNAALSAGSGGPAAAAGGAAGAPPGAGAAESTGEDLAASSGINQWDVLDNAIDSAEGYGACRRQLNSLIDWVEATTN